ncbi:MAG: hypothetical protein KDA41_03835, partial [Planctomycetales bacterium]|nr:hypothetical protein [Planctomycetales bacterium]
MDSATINHLLEQALSPQVLWLVLWSGLAVLTLTLMLMMGTRWGQAHPLSKCVFLSVFAHMLLVCYAYMTDLFTDKPRGPGRSLNEVHVRFIANAENEQFQPTPPQEQPWERLAATEPPPPLETALTREIVEAQLEPQRNTDASVPTPGADLPTEVATAGDFTITSDQPLPLPAAAALETTAPQAAEVEVPQSVVREEALPIGPDEASPARASALHGDLVEPIRTSVKTLPDELVAGPAELQRLADVDPVSESANLIAARTDVVEPT